MASPKTNHRGAAPTKARTTKTRPLLLRRAMLHSCLCFLLGLFTGLAPSDWTDAASRAAASAHVLRALHAVRAIKHTTSSLLLHRHQVEAPAPPAPQLLVVVTTTGQSERERRAAGLTRTAHALRLVSPPVVWLVVEPAREAPPTARLLRGTGVVYRHVTYKENFSSDAAGGINGEERHHQRNVALGHIEQHRLRGFVLFAGLGDVYDLRLLEQLRQIRTFGAWPVATVHVWEQEKRVALEGPVCSRSTSTAGWFSTRTWSTADDGEATRPVVRTRPSLADVDVHGFAFCSDLLWDPARWDRFPTSEPDQSQDSIKFVQRLLVEDYNKTRAMPADSNCSQIMVWRVDTTLL
ncbi:probable beta-1,4-xylosyltransferase IRX9 [Phragmites australis]|uniref:probable beta-1,4-xylosyltransferase IRX9 n=1 Tax=Phragmites australis TaxID=29695 RepID=UPI002D7846FD|nr:probable beta-1,4-xylosyltransferase IRX9 [Phragmites australis]